MINHATPDRRKIPSAGLRKLLPVIGTVCLLLIATVAPGFSAEYDLAPEPSWVKPSPISVNASVPIENLSNGVFYLLSESQTRVEPQGEVERYSHMAIKVINTSGVEAASQVSVTFDPEYERVLLHYIRVHRGRSHTDQLAPGKIKVLQRESQLEYQIYDGSKSLNVILDDVRIGDIVEYGYTLVGGNPVFAGHYFSRMGAQWSDPVHRVRRRLLWPGDRPLFIKNHGTDLKPVVREQPGYREYIWSLDDVPPLYMDNETPDWYDPYPWVQVSDMASWQEVVAWARRLYRIPERVSPELEALVAGIKSSYPDDAGRVAAVLRFTQDQVRYMGIEIGPKSHAPSDPSVVFARRFGDCKDKVLLGLTMLGRLGIRAEPALVNSRVGKRLQSYLPSPTVFNHVILKVYADGRVHWLDPTITLQRGPLAQIFQPDYGRALVLSERTTALERMAVLGNREPTKLVQDTFDLGKGVGQAATYTVQTIYTSHSADYIRRLVADTSKQELQKNYLKFYADRYPSIRLDQELAIEDDETANRITITEKYLIPGMWEKEEGTNKLTANFIPQDLNSYLVGPDTLLRTMPFRVGHPINVRQTTRVLLPEPWKVETGHQQIEDPAFLFSSDVRYGGNQVTLEYRYQSRKDSVDPDDIEAFKQHINQADNLAWFWLRAPDPAAPAPVAADTPRKTSGLNWTAVVAAIMSLLLSFALAVKLYRFDPEPVGSPDLLRPQQASGIGGWLVLVALGLISQPFLIVTKNYDLNWVFQLDPWTRLTTPGTEAYHVLWAPVLIWELAGNIALVIASVVLAVLFFQKRSSLPKVFIYFRLGALAFYVADNLLASQIPSIASQSGAGDQSELVRQGIFSLIWISYFLKSARVKATFIRRRKAAPRISEPVPLRPDDQRICPRCAAAVVERVATRGPYQGKAFLVCSDYPQCKHVELAGT